MAIDFFQKEQEKVWDRFNETFGDSLIVKPDIRCDVIFSILNLGLIAKELKKSKPANSQNKVKEFMSCKAALYLLFKKLENEVQKESGFENAGDKYETSNDARRFKSV
jgi:hypothetical protein